MPEALAALVPREICEKNLLVPLQRENQKLLVAMADPTDHLKLDDLAFIAGMPILPDAGIFGSDDIIAVEQATLDIIARDRLIEENIPTSLEVHTRQGHPFAWLHGPLKDPYVAVAYGEKLGLGSRDYELMDVLPVENIRPAPMGYIPAQ